MDWNEFKDLKAEVGYDTCHSRQRHSRQRRSATQPPLSELQLDGARELQVRHARRCSHVTQEKAGLKSIAVASDPNQMAPVRILSRKESADHAYLSKMEWSTPDETLSQAFKAHLREEARVNSSSARESLQSQDNSWNIIASINLLLGKPSGGGDAHF